jgi:hypothetical protein
MKNNTRKFLAMLILTLAYQGISTSSFAQAPSKMSYQCVVRDAGGNLVTNQEVGLTISILQGSSTGAIVYQEIYNPDPQTDVNGLLTIEIGGGLPITGVFADINWAVGLYFLKTETDPTGGTTYTITGTSQLLSVPYALYAKTAEDLTGTVAIAHGGTGAITVAGAKTNFGLDNVDNTTDLLKPVSTATQTALDLKAPLASPTFTGTPLATTAIAGTNTTQVATTAFVTSALAASSPVHFIGESYGGGIVFYVYDGGQHGLIAALNDQSAEIQWYNGVFRLTGTTGDGVGAGAMNTAMIVATQMADYQLGNFAAKVCADYSVTFDDVTYGDWYLPSKHELNLLYLQQTVVGNFGNKNYWSSTELGELGAWGQFFSDGFQLDGKKDDDRKFPRYRVRAIRAF